MCARPPGEALACKSPERAHAPTSPTTPPAADPLGRRLPGGDPRVDTDEVPLPDADHPEPWTAWRNWLGTRGLGLVPVPSRRVRLARPVARAAARGRGRGRLRLAARRLAWAPAGGRRRSPTSRRGYVVAPADVALWAPSPPRPRAPTARVEALAVASAAEAPMALVDSAQSPTPAAGSRATATSTARARSPTRTPRPRPHADRGRGRRRRSALAPAEAPRRNVVTRGIDLNALVGRRFRVGEVECVGQRLCEPCAHLQRLTEPGMLRALVHRGGLRADMLDGRHDPRRRPPPVAEAGARRATRPARAAGARPA